MTSLEHAAIAVGVQLLVGLCLGNWWIGGLLSCCWFVAREHTQAEYRWIEAFASGRRAGMPWWGGNANCRIESSELLILGTKR